MRKLLVPLTLVGLCGAGVFAAIGIGGESRNVPRAGSLRDAYEPANADTLHRVAAPSAGANSASVVTAAKKKGKKVRIRYFETDAFPMLGTGDATGDSLSCPPKNKVLGGYFGSDGVDVALTFSAPETTRRWFVGISQVPGFLGGEAENAFLGIVCAKGVK
ncbi:MAG TPA: hypothetical protein VHJ54_07080 [Solirubrobacterales bacterium]|jgi:hypothetical protein|nr:hypothetical protein [Solirubrobacterales bacterium]